MGKRIENRSLFGPPCMYRDPEDEYILHSFVPQVGLPIIVDVPGCSSYDIFFNVTNLPAIVVWETKITSRAGVRISLSAITDGATNNQDTDSYALLPTPKWNEIKLGDLVDCWTCQQTGKVRLRFGNSSLFSHARFEYRAYLLYADAVAENEPDPMNVSTKSVEKCDTIVSAEKNSNRRLLLWLQPHQILRQSFINFTPESEMIAVAWSSKADELADILMEVGPVKTVFCVFRTAPLPNAEFFESFQWELKDVFRQCEPLEITVLSDVKCVALYFLRESWQQGHTPDTLVCITDSHAPPQWRFRTCCFVQGKILPGTGFCDDEDLHSTMNTCTKSIMSVVGCEHVLEYQCNTDELRNLGVDRDLAWPGMFKVMLGLPKLRTLVDILSMEKSRSSHSRIGVSRSFA